MSAFRAAWPAWWFSAAISNRAGLNLAMDGAAVAKFDLGINGAIIVWLAMAGFAIFILTK